jgi:hypothetical protein
MIDGEVNRGIREVLQQFITQMQSQKRVPIPAKSDTVLSTPAISTLDPVASN